MYSNAREAESFSLRQDLVVAMEDRMHTAEARARDEQRTTEQLSNRMRDLE